LREELLPIVLEKHQALTLVQQQGKGLAEELIIAVAPEISVKSKLSMIKPVTVTSSPTATPEPSAQIPEKAPDPSWIVYRLSVAYTDVTIPLLQLQFLGFENLRPHQHSTEQ